MKTAKSNTTSGSKKQSSNNTKVNNNTVTKGHAQKDSKQSFGPKKNYCDICAQSVPGPEREQIFAFGKCDHFICYVCSARLRVICDQLDCAICREKLDTVIFSNDTSKPFAKVKKEEYILDQRYNIYFADEAIKQAFDKLLVYECLQCQKSQTKSRSKLSKSPPTTDSSRDTGSPNEHDVSNQTITGQGPDTQSAVQLKILQANSAVKTLDDAQQQVEKPQGAVVAKSFPNISTLRNHLNNVHKLKLCDLCLAHNKVFPFEYSYYSVGSLERHIRDGEPKTSHRGHPSCALCNSIFFNTDELIQHMSREHFHCHLCGRHDSNLRIYFSDYPSLREHFKTKHFLCERENCRHEQFTSAFDSRLEYQIHVSNVHGGGATRQQRTITLEPTSVRPPSRNHDNHASSRTNGAVVTTGTVATANNQRRPQTGLVPQRVPTRMEFPALEVGSGLRSNVQQNPNNGSTSSNTPGGAGPSHMLPPSYSRSIGGVSAYRRTTQGLQDMDFPPLPEQKKPKGSKNINKKLTGAKPKMDPANMTLDQLVNYSLTMSDQRVSSTRGGGKVVKRKPLKIQL